jgi:hypothetical protein
MSVSAEGRQNIAMRTLAGRHMTLGHDGIHYGVSSTEERRESAYGGQTHGTVEGSEWGEVNPQPAPSGSANWIRSRRALEAMQPVFGSDRTSRFCDQSSGLRSPR